MAVYISSFVKSCLTLFGVCVKIEHQKSVGIHEGYIMVIYITNVP